MYVRFYINRDIRVSLPSFLILVPIWFALVYFTISTKVNSFQRESAEDNQTEIQVEKNAVRRASVAFLFGSVFCLPPIGVLAAWYIMYRGGVSLDSPDPMVRRWSRAMVWLGIVVLMMTAIFALTLWLMSNSSFFPKNCPMQSLKLYTTVKSKNYFLEKKYI